MFRRPEAAWAFRGSNTERTQALVVQISPANMHGFVPVHS